MKKVVFSIIAFLFLFLVSGTAASPDRIIIGKKNYFAGKVEKSTLSLSGSENPFKARIAVPLGGKKRVFRVDLNPGCNKKLPPDCTFFFDFADNPATCKASFCKPSDRFNDALRAIKKRKAFSAFTVYQKRNSPRIVTKRFLCKKSKKPAVSCKFKKVVRVEYEIAPRSEN